MNKYIPHTSSEIKEMLKVIGVENIEELFREIPKEIMLGRDLNLPKGMSELEVERKLANLANKNRGTDKLTCFLGAGSYDHYIPTLIRHIISRSEFSTAYTPYQPEIAQGTLQYIFEYQTMITELTGMDVSNASMYDGATATVEAIFMALAIAKKRKKFLVSDTIHPNTLEVIKTYARYRELEIELLESTDGHLDYDEVISKLDKSVAGVVVQNPNFYGVIETYRDLADKIHENKSVFIVNTNPMSLALLKAPKDYGADIVCGDAQSFGVGLNYGGPYIGFLATTTKYMRKLPGRICGMTKDVDGKRAFVLTLQAREQHIKREKANSNICSNQSLLALATTIYMSLMGKGGIKEVASQSVAKTHYLADRLLETGKFQLAYDKPYFYEVALKYSGDLDELISALKEEGILAGYKHGDKLLISVTEKRTKEEIENFIELVGGMR